MVSLHNVDGFLAGALVTPAAMVMGSSTLGGIVKAGSRLTDSQLAVVKGIGAVLAGIILTVTVPASSYSLGFKTAVIVSSAFAGSLSGFYQVIHHAKVLFDEKVKDPSPDAFYRRSGGEHIKYGQLCGIAGSLVGSVVGLVGTQVFNPVLGCCFGAVSAHSITHFGTQFATDDLLRGL